MWIQNKKKGKEGGGGKTMTYDLKIAQENLTKCQKTLRKKT